MVKLEHILRDYREAGSVNGLLALWGFVDEDGTFLTKAGHVGAVYRVSGIDYEGLDASQRQALTHRFEAGLRLLDEHCRVYQYLVKQTIEELVAAPCSFPVAHEAIQRRTEYLNSRRQDLYDVELFLVVVYESPVAARTATRLRGVWRAPRRALREWLSVNLIVQLLERDLDQALATLHHKLRALEVQLAEFGLLRQEKQGAFRFFRRLVNHDRETAMAAALRCDTHLDYFVADSAVDCYRDHLRIGHRLVKVLSMKEAPSQTFAFLLKNLYLVPGDFLACVEWQRIPSDRMRRDLQARRRHFWNKRISMVNYVSSDTTPEEMLVDDSAGATVKQLGDALTEIEVNGHFFGQCSLTFVLHDTDLRRLQRQVAETRKVLALHDASLYEETYNLLNAWLSVVPGNGAHNLRRLALLETHVADLSLLFALDQGSSVSPHLNREALARFETPHHTLYSYNLHVDDVGHTLVLGATGAGKSFLLNFLVTHAQKYDPLTIIIDLGQSYKKLATLLGGSYLDIDAGQPDVKINPFAFPPTPEHVHFLHGFVRVLLEGDDGYRLSELEDREIYEAVENLYVLDPSQRRLFTMANLLPRALAGRLHKWIDGGRYAAFFDHLEDSLTFDRLQVFDLEGMRSYPALLEPLLFYVLRRIVAHIHDPANAHRLKLLIMDEAWCPIQHPTVRAYVHEELKTGRKHNAAMILASQAVDDFASADLLRTLVESCPTKLLLANPAFDRRQYGELFGMNDMELDLLANLMPRQQILLKRPNLTKTLTLNVDPRSYWIYTNTPIDNERVAAVFREHGFAAGLDRLSQPA